MSKYRKIFFAICVLSFSANVFCEEVPAPKAKQPDIAVVSEALGHLIGKNLEEMGVKLDIAKVIQGLQDSSKGKESPLSEKECIDALAAVQEEAFLQLSKENLSQAESFLKKNETEHKIVSLEKGKIQYKVEKEGSGSTIEAHSTPKVSYTGKLLDGSIFGSSQESETLSLDELIPGLKTALIGMREGEKRTVYIHPELGYGTSGYLPPNSLLTFEVEVVKAHQEGDKESSVKISTDSTTSAKQEAEISLKAKDETHIR